jgi:hypothetical protein
MFELENELIGEYARLAIQRHYDDVKKSENNNFPYYYDQKAADTYISL